jgi:hypothetical protein
MAREQASVNAAQHYGPREANTGLPDSVSTYGVVTQLEVYFDYAQAAAGLPSDNANIDAATLVIPANSLIKNVYLETSTAYASGAPTTDGLTIGVQNTDGTTNDADGFFLATSTNTDDLAVGWVAGDGVLVGASVGATDVQIAIDVAAGTLTAGQSRLIVEYIAPYSA